MIPEQKPRLLNLAATKLILLVIFLVSFGIVLGVAGYLANNKSAVDSEPVASITPEILTTPTPAITPDISENIEGWQNYRSDKYSFGFQYPSGWTLKNENDGSDLVLAKFNLSYSGDRDYWLSIDINIENEIVDKDIKTFLAKRGVTEKLTLKTSIDGKEAVGFSWLPGKGQAPVGDLYYFLKNGAAYTISTSYDEKSDGVIKQILSTFRFIQKDEIVNLKTYKNEKYGFEVKYPTNLIFVIESETANELHLNWTKPDDLGVYGLLSAYSIVLDEEKTLEQFIVSQGDIQGYYSHNTTPNLVKKQFKGVDMLEYFTQTYVLEDTTVSPIDRVTQFFKKSDIIFRIDYLKQKEETVNQILSTFKFIK
ncbi:MAG: PsbP-related protein [bacterium]|nr:PsbP-related protein [bacterium]